MVVTTNAECYGTVYIDSGTANSGTADTTPIFYDEYATASSTDTTCTTTQTNNSYEWRLIATGTNISENNKVVIINFIIEGDYIEIILIFITICYSPREKFTIIKERSPPGKKFINIICTKTSQFYKYKINWRYYVSLLERRRRQ